MKIEKKQKLTKEWFVKLQNIICNSVEQLEKEYGSNRKFNKNKWKHGEFRTIKGEVIEKGGVAFSNLAGKFSKEFTKKIPGTKNNTNFWSSGVSVVLHPKNPKIPAMHFNTRFICTKKNWFGGGIDVTPCLIDNGEKKYFHDELKKICDLHNKKYYPKYKKWCDEYFYLPHRGESRGIGGIFFDYKMDDWRKDFSFIKDVGNTFVHIVKTITKRKCLKNGQKKKKKFNYLKEEDMLNLIYYMIVVQNLG